MLSFKYLAVPATLLSVVFAFPQAEGSAMAGHDMGDMPGNDTEPDLSKRPPFACAHLEVYHFDGAGSVGLENMGRELQKNMAKQLKNVTTTGVFYNSFDSDFNRTVLATAETAAAVLKGKVGLCPDSKIALSGYSLGAMVLHGIQLDPEVQSKVVAVVTYGDPILDVEFHQNRLELPINSKGCIIRNCNKGDYFCDAKGRENGTSDPNDWTPHWDYVRDGTAMKAAKAITKCYKAAQKAEKKQV